MSVILNLQDELNFRKISLSSLSRHRHNTFKSKIGIDEEKIALLIENPTHVEVTDTQVHIKHILTEEQMKNFMQFEKRLIKSFSQKLIQEECIDTLMECLSIFQSNIIYDENDDNKAYFSCIFDRNETWVEDMVAVKDSCSSEALKLFLCPYEIIYKTVGYISIQYQARLEKEEVRIMNEEEKESPPNSFNIEQDCFHIVDAAKKRMKQLDQKKEEIKSSLVKYLNSVGDISSLSERQESEKKMSRYMEKYEEKKKILADLISI